MCAYVHFTCMVCSQVLRGGDRKVDFIVKDPNHKTIALEPWKSDGALEKDIEVEGKYFPISLL